MAQSAPRLTCCTTGLPCEASTTIAPRPTSSRAASPDLPSRRNPPLRTARSPARWESKRRPTNRQTRGIVRRSKKTDSISMSGKVNVTAAQKLAIVSPGDIEINQLLTTNNTLFFYSVRGGRNCMYADKPARFSVRM